MNSLLVGTWMNVIDQKEVVKNVSCPGTRFHSEKEGAIKVYYSYKLNEELKKEMIENEALTENEAREEYQIGYAGTLHF